MNLPSLIVIPTRLAASRLPNKPLANICGKPMIQHVWERAVSANVGPVIVACGDQEILEVVRNFGGEGIMTDPGLPSGTDRVKVAADVYDPQGKFEAVINIQGDLPALDPALVKHVLEPLRQGEVDIATLGTLISEPQELTDPNVVKIALALSPGEDVARALYFSRNSIPSGEGAYFHHIGLYAYKRNSLDRYVNLPVHPLELRERLEQLRALAHGMRIDVKVVETETPFGVDTPADLERAIQILGVSK